MTHAQDHAVVHRRIHIHTGARQVLLDLPKPARRRLQHAIDGLADLAQPTGAVPLTGQPGAFRLRVGGHQVVYAVRDHEVLILVIADADANAA